MRLGPEYKKAASALKGVVKVGAVNADEHQQLGGQSSCVEEQLYQTKQWLKQRTLNLS